MKFFFDKFQLIFDIENWLWKYNFGTFWETGAPRILKIQRFPLSLLIFVQKSCFLGPTIFEIPQPNWQIWMECARLAVLFFLKSLVMKPLRPKPSYFFLILSLLQLECYLLLLTPPHSRIFRPSLRPCYLTHQLHRKVSP